MAAALRRSSHDANRRARLIAHCLRQGVRGAVPSSLSTSAAAPPLPPKVGPITFVTLTSDIIEDYLPQSQHSGGNGGGGGGAATRKGARTALLSAPASALSAGEVALAALTRSSAVAAGRGDDNNNSITNTNTADNDDDTTNGGTTAASAAVAPAGTSSIANNISNNARLYEGAALAYALPFTQRAAPPRAVFTCGQGGVLLRSVDGGRSWRRIRVPNADEDDGDASDGSDSGGEGNASDASEDSDGDDDAAGARLSDILSLMLPTTATTSAAANNKKDGDENDDDDHDNDDIEGIAAFVAAEGGRGRGKAKSEQSALVKAIAEAQREESAQQLRRQREAKEAALSKRKGNSGADKKDKVVFSSAPSIAATSVGARSVGGGDSCLSDILNISCGVSGVSLSSPSFFSPPPAPCGRCGAPSQSSRDALSSVTKKRSSEVISDAFRTDYLLHSGLFSDVVAICGQNGLLAVSIDRGARFTRLPARLLRRAASSSTATATSGGSPNPAWFRDKTSSANEFVSFLGAVVVPNVFQSSSAVGSDTTRDFPFRVIFHTSNRVFSVAFGPSSLHTIAFSNSINVLVGPSPMPVGCVEVLPVMSCTSSSSPSSQTNGSTVGAVGCPTCTGPLPSGGSGGSSAPKQISRQGSASLSSLHLPPFIVAVSAPSALHFSLDGGCTLAPIEVSGGGTEGEAATPQVGTAARSAASAAGQLTAIRHQAGLIRAARPIPTRCLPKASLSAVAREVAAEGARAAAKASGNRTADGQVKGASAAASALAGPEGNASSSASSQRGTFTYTTATPLSAATSADVPTDGKAAPALAKEMAAALAGIGGEALFHYSSPSPLPLVAMVAKVTPSPPSGPSASASGGSGAPTTSIIGHCAFAVLGTDGPLVNFDFTCLLHLCVVVTNSSEQTLANGSGSSGVSLVTVLEHVAHTPFVASGPTERVGLGVFAGGGGGGGAPSALPICLVRSNRAGVSVSQSFGAEWSRPCHAYTGAVCLPPSDAFARLFAAAATPPSASSSAAGGGSDPSSASSSFTQPPMVIVGGSKQCLLISEGGFLPSQAPQQQSLLGDGGGSSSTPSAKKPPAAAPKGRGAGGGASSPPSTEAPPPLFEVVPIAAQHRVKMVYGTAALW